MSEYYFIMRFIKIIILDVVIILKNGALYVVEGNKKHLSIFLLVVG